MKERKERTTANLSHSAVCLMTEPEPPMNAGRIYVERIEIDAEWNTVGASRGRSEG